VLLGTYNFNAGTNGSVVVRNDGASGYVIADAVEFVSVATDPPAPGVVAQRPQFTNVIMQTNGQFQLHFKGDTNSSYHVWASTNLVNWQDLGPGVLTTNGAFQFIDAGSTNQPQRFYRVVNP
jgi:hypothetical protein